MVPATCKAMAQNNERADARVGRKCNQARRGKDEVIDYIRVPLSETKDIFPFQFKAISETAVHSSSIVDLFSMFHQAVDFVQNLQWPNELQRCKFLTVLSKVWKWKL